MLPRGTRSHWLLLQVKAVFVRHGLEMVAQVYSSKELGCLVVELTRRAGDAFVFNDARENLARELAGVISGAADVKAIANRCVLQALVSMNISSSCSVHVCVKT